MIFFVAFLRSLAACLITNSHYTGIYPYDIIANGGLIGDVIFFAVSGYCLYHCKNNFLQWYKKRIYRIYIPVSLTTIVFILLGSYSLSEHSLFWYLIYPTYYHFVASIIILYIPFYFTIRWDLTKKHIPSVMLVIFLLALVYYTFFYDKTYYHIDTVREPFIRVLFFESMLLGAYFRSIDNKIRNHFSWKYPIIAVISFILYFTTKIIFSKIGSISQFQILNQIVIFILLWAIMRTCISLDSCLERMPNILKKAVVGLSNITLEVYVVQYVLIEVLRPYFKFPINWLVITVSILLAACVVHWICQGIYLLMERIINICRNRKSMI